MDGCPQAEALLRILERPYRRNGELERIAIRIAKINGRRMIPKGEFFFDGYAMFTQSLAPGITLMRFDPKSNMAGPRCAVSGKESAQASYVCAEKQQDGRTRADLESRSAASFEISIGNLAQAENAFVKRDGSIQVCDVKRRLENRMRR
jgi:hypothetical protein